MKKEIREVVITPEYAEELLKMNINNRAVRTKKVAELAEVMKKGEWELSNDAIVVSEGNILLNGQHRLMAVVKSGVACPFILYTGAEDSSFDIMDTPIVRRVADAIVRKGGKNSVQMETTISRYMNLHEDLLSGWESMKRFSSKTAGTRRELVEMFDKHEKLFDKWVKWVNATICKGVRLVSGAQLAALAAFLERDLGHEEDRIKEYIKALVLDGASQHKTILAVRKKLMLHNMKRERLDRHDILRYLIRGWNDFLLNREVIFIKTDEDSFYFIRPF